MVEIVPPAAPHGRDGASAVTAEVRWSGDKQMSAHAVQRAWEHVRAHADATSSGATASSSVDDVHFQEALLASSPLFISISAPEVLADISRVSIDRSLAGYKVDNLDNLRSCVPCPPADRRVKVQQ